MKNKTIIKNNVTVSIGIPAYNEEHNIDNLLKQLLSQKQERFVIEKIIVASDGSTDKTVEIAKKYIKKSVEVIEGKRNRGQTYRQNEIISKVSSDILVLINADLFLNNDKVIAKLISPILNNSDLTAQWAKPVPSQTFLGKVLEAGFIMKYYVYTRYKKGNNIYTCIGHLRALSRNFYTYIKFPEISHGEDQYLYLACMSRGYRYKYVSSKGLFFKLPDSFKEYKNYARRIFQTQKKYTDIFDKKLTNNERSLPFFLLLRGFMYAFIRHPIYTLFYIVLHVVMYRWALRQSTTSSHAFETAQSTKRVSIPNNYIMR